MGTKILVVAEGRDGKFKKGSLECLSEASKIKGALGGDVTALVVGGPAMKGAAGSLGAAGADKVLVCAADWLERYNGDAYARVAAAAIKAESPSVVFVSASTDGKDLSPRIAALLDAGLAADVTGVTVEGGTLTITRPTYAGKAYATLVIKTPTQVVSVRPNAFQVAPRAGAGKVEDFASPIKADDVGAKVIDVKAAKADKADLTEAERIVAGGRGLKSAEGFKLLEDFAAEIGGVVGASRAVVDLGWRAHADQIGQTGKTVSANLYFAVGVSGAIQHLAGMSTSKCIVAINKDKDAPIFKVADYGIVGDLFEVMPRLTEEVKKLKK